MQGRICLITGGTSGIGKTAATDLARRGATVVLLGRNPEKLRAAVEEMRAQTGNRKVESLTCDLASLGAVREAAKEFRDRYPALHVLINNAGSSPEERIPTPDGLETTLSSTTCRTSS